MIQLAHRIVLTELCNRNCEHCFNADFRKTAVMDADKLIEFWRINSANLYPKRVKFMGGEPTLHPRILDIIHEACLHFGGVDIFTNGTTMERITKDPLVLRYHLTGVIHYIINGFTFEEDKLKDYMPFVNNIALHFVIDDEVEKMRATCSKIRRCMQLGIAHIIISPNTQVNLFDDETQDKYRAIWIEAITTLVPELIASGVGFNYDHVLPICFYTQEMLDQLHAIPGVHNKNSFLDAIHSMKITCCCESQMGLILPNFDLMFCNQTLIKIGSILDDNGNPRLMEDILRSIQPFSKIKTDCIKNLHPKCAACPVVGSCKVGCYYTTLLRAKGELDEK